MLQSTPGLYQYVLRNQPFSDISINRNIIRQASARPTILTKDGLVRPVQSCGAANKLNPFPQTTREDIVSFEPVLSCLLLQLATPTLTSTETSSGLFCFRTYAALSTRCRVSLRAEVVTRAENRRKRLVRGTEMLSRCSPLMEIQCDQGKPACSRCTRLGISCVGGGKQRFKFKAQMVQLNGLVSIDIEDERSSGTGTVTSSSSSSNSITPPNGALIRLPGNSTTMAVNAFIARLEVPDIRYDLTCFGEFLRYIPSRLGHNEALDASADALATTFSYTVQGAPSERRVAALRKYGIALNKLRICLGDPKKAKTANTMCAIYLVLVCQVGRLFFSLPSSVLLTIKRGGSAAMTRLQATAKDWRTFYVLRLPRIGNLASRQK